MHDDTARRTRTTSDDGSAIGEPFTGDVPTSRRSRRRAVLLASGLVAVGAIAFVMVWFQPHKLFIDDRVDDTLPGLVRPAAASEAAGDLPTPVEPAADAPAIVGDDLAQGTDDNSVSAVGSDEVSGADGAEEVEEVDEIVVEPDPETVADPLTETAPRQSLADLHELAASTGAPQVVSDSEFISLDKSTEGVALLVAMPDGSTLIRFEEFRTGNGPDVYIELSRGGPTDGDYGDMLRLDRMRGNVGDQNYVIPAGTDLTEFGSIIIWCERFSQPFGAAALTVPV